MNDISFERIAPPVVSRPTARRAFVVDPVSQGHAVQFYEEPEFLFHSVAEFIGRALKRHDPVLLIARKAHLDGIMARLPAAEVANATQAHRFITVEVRSLLQKFMAHDTVNASLFREAISELVEQLGTGRTGVTQVYGELVDVLWKEGHGQAAVELEGLWSEAVRRHSMNLMCAYSMESFYRAGDTAHFIEICNHHHHVGPTERFARLEDPVERLREISQLQQKAQSLESEVRLRRTTEKALRAALQDRNRIEEELKESLEREALARAQAEESAVFKEVFIGILGHDLRNPLNTILTTARLMLMRSELNPDNRKRIERITTSSHRMDRMIGTLLDLARIRLSGGIPLGPVCEQNVLPVIAKVVSDVRQLDPERAIEVDPQEACLASVDIERFEQVVMNLVSNAVRFGSRDVPVRISCRRVGETTVLSVRNGGPPIERDRLPTLFNPFKRPPGEVSGHVGLGLFVAERIVASHGGTIRVSSSAEEGTCFEASFPRR